MKAKAGIASNFEFTCRLAAGLHARPASHLAEVASAFASHCTLENLRSGAVADMKSTLSLIAAEVRNEDRCLVRIEGADEAAARATLRKYVDHDLPLTDEPLESPPAKAGALPRDLRETAVEAISGIPASAGIGRGRVVLLGMITLPPEIASEAGGNTRDEQARVDAAMSAARAELEAQLGRRTTSTEHKVLRAHLSLLADPSLAGRISERIAAGNAAGKAVVDACETFVALLRSSGSQYIRERALDMQDVCRRLLRGIYGERFRNEVPVLSSPSILVAENCSPQQLLSLNREHLRGLVIEAGGATSHTLILARSLGIAALSGAHDATRTLVAGDEIVVDGNRGFVVTKITPAVERFYQREERTLAQRSAILRRTAMSPVTTRDGVRIEIGANIATPEELSAAFGNGADGIGVFRTEMLFAGRSDPPSESEQYQAYAAAARAAGQKPVILRTLDVGGDKPLDYLSMPAEPNPFLGMRGARIYTQHADMIRTQLRAILRASAHGRVWLMLPMISTTAEVRTCKALFAEVKAELDSGNVQYDSTLPFGVMIEVPSAVFAIEELAREVDFFSIGTNDLAQYFFAADRDNPALASLANPRHPSFLRLLKQACDGARKSGKWIGLCGAMAADPRHLPIMLGLGVNELGVPAADIPQLKERAAALSAATCAAMLANALQCSTEMEVDALLDEAGAASQPLLTDDLIVIGSEARNKDEAIRELVDAMWIHGRIADRVRMEEAVWAREQVYSTGLGFGFAIPHCKTDAVQAASIAVLRLAAPIDWQGTDGSLVHNVILLALRENAAKQHMQVFARLARKLMDESFRAEFSAAGDVAAIRACFEKYVDVRS